MRLNSSALSGHREKFVFRRGAFRASDSVGASFLLADLIAHAYGSTLPKLAHGDFLDLGCGGAPLRPLYEGTVEQVLYADIERRDGGLSPFVRLDAGSGLPFQSSSFDVVLLSDVLEHIHTPQSTVTEVARILRPGGVIVGNTPFLYWVHEEPNDFWRPTKFALTRSLEQAGFVDVEVNEVGGSVEVVLDIIAKHAATLPYVGVPIGSAVGKIGSHWARSRSGRAVSAKTGAKYPMAHFFSARVPVVPSTTGSTS